jgi:prepilin-type N-terminal cleavage/methylation domain-containing protein
MWPASVNSRIRKHHLSREGLNHDQGLTLLECVVAIAIVALTGALMTPPLFLAAATRVQNRKAEQALQIAQGEIDRIRTLVEQGEHNLNNLPAVVNDINGVPAPNAIEASIRTVNNTCLNLYDNLSIPATSVLPVDVDGDCDEDFYLQSFRTEGGIVDAGQPSNFEVGVRVYANNAATNGTLRPGLETTQASLKFTQGEGNQRQFPMAVLYTDVTWDGSGVSLFCYHGADACTTP